MNPRQPKDLNNDGKIDDREVATSNLGFKAMNVLRDKKNGLNKEGKPINQAGVDNHFLDMFEHDDDEVIVAEIRKHPIGLVAIWGATILVIAIIWSLVVSLALFRDDLSSTLNGRDLTMTGLVIGFGVTVLALIFGYIAAFLYVNNLLLVTSEKLVQIRYLSIFNRKVSSLSIGEVQDVTAQQNGLLPMLFGYGTIVIESAGEQNNYNFTMAKEPNKGTKTIVECHEKSIHKYGN